MSPLELSGSISLRLYPHNELSAPEIVEELRAQARLASSVGFDGVMVSEHHGGFSGYLPSPLQMAGFLLEAMDVGWAGPCPMLLPLKPVAQVAEDTAWLAARFPNRVILGVAPGSLEGDFEVMEIPHDERMPRYRRQLGPLVKMLSGDADSIDGRVGEIVAGDRAVMHCRDHPVPVLGAAMSVPACQRAARVGAGLLFDSLSTCEHLRAIADEYRASGGTGTAILNRRVWMGAPPRPQVDAQVDLYASYAASSAVASWGSDELITSDDPDEIVSQLATAVTSSGSDALNIRVHSAGVSSDDIRRQIELIGREVVPNLRAKMEVRRRRRSEGDADE